MQSSEHDIWIEALGDRAAPVPGQMKDEVDALRRYFSNLRDMDEAPAAPVRPGRQARMQQWLRERGAFDAAAPVMMDEPLAKVAPQFPRRTAANGAWYATAAAMVFALCLVPLWRSQLPEPAAPETFAMRGAQAIQRLPAAAPLTRAAQVEQAFAAIGLTLRRVQTGDAIRLETRVPADRMGQARAILSPFHLRLPDNGILIIDVVPQP